MRLGSTVQMQRRDFNKRPPDVLSVFLRHMRWLMVCRKPRATPVLGQGHSPVRRYTPPPHTGHKATRMGWETGTEGALGWGRPQGEG